MCTRYAPDELAVLVEIAEYAETRLHLNRPALVDLLSAGGAPDWTTVQRVFAGRYDKPGPFIQSRCLPALKMIRADVAGFVETPVVRDITSCLEQWSRDHVMAEIVGTAGRSKTFAAREWHLDNPDSVYIDCPAVGGIGAFLREIARQIGAATSGSLDHLSENIRGKLDKRNTLLVDEVARILPSTPNPRSPEVRILNFLHRLHDKNGVTVVFIATDIFDDTFSDYKLEKFLAQLHRRILYRYEIPKVSTREIFLIVRAFRPDVDKGKAADMALLKEAMQIGSGPDGIGPLFVFLKNAKLLADAHGESLRVEHLQDATKYSRNRIASGRSVA
jgi:hypothetical protein